MKVNKINCPLCGRELIRLEPYEPGSYNFWCDDCDVNIDITNDENKPKSAAYYMGSLVGVVMCGGVIALGIALTIKALALILF